ncbi:hypothetical protein N9S52_06405, partial [Gammaproteobacteria bacterium]|nr:hypothetical protein [Gammaproteobacteria bacterium]
IFSGQTPSAVRCEDIGLSLPSLSDRVGDNYSDFVTIQKPKWAQLCLKSQAARPAHREQCLTISPLGGIVSRS